MNRFVFIIVFFAITFYMANRIASDFIERDLIKKCIRYEERERTIRKEIDGVSFMGNEIVIYCSEWKYEDGDAA